MEMEELIMIQILKMRNATKMRKIQKNDPNFKKKSSSKNVSFYTFLSYKKEYERLCRPLIFERHQKKLNLPPF